MHSILLEDDGHVEDLQSLGEASVTIGQECLAATKARRDELIEKIGPRNEFAAWIDERLDRVISANEHAEADTSRARIGFVDPLDFVPATSIYLAMIADEAGDVDVGQITDEKQSPFLIMEDGVIVGHEGRHRMIAMAKAGVTRAPTVFYERLPFGEEYAYEKLLSQDVERFGSQTYYDNPSMDTSLHIHSTVAATSSSRAEIVRNMERGLSPRGFCCRGCNLCHEGKR